MNCVVVPIVNHIRVNPVLCIVITLHPVTRNYTTPFIVITVKGVVNSMLFDNQ